MEDRNERIQICMKEYMEHGVPSFPIFIWLYIPQELHLFNIWFN